MVKDYLIRIVLTMYLFSIIYIVLYSLAFGLNPADFLRAMDILTLPSGFGATDIIPLLNSMYKLATLPYHIPLPPFIDVIWKATYVLIVTALAIEFVRSWIPFVSG